MARPLNKLSDVKIRGQLKLGRHGDGGGLYLNVGKSGGKSWVFLYASRAGGTWGEGKQSARKELGLGPYPDVTLARARELAGDYRALLARGEDPSIARQKGVVTFADAAEKLIDSMTPSWRNQKHRDQWKMTLGDAYCQQLRPKDVASVDVDDVLSVLSPIWQAKPETASRLRGRIERVLDYAKVKGWRSGENPAVWRNNLKHVLPARQSLSRGHHAALPYEQMPALMEKIRAAEGLSALALEVLILTASRTGEVVGMRWGELDLDAAVWTVPAVRMKNKKVHRVPLPARAVEVLRGLEELAASDYVFPGEHRGRRKAKDRPLSQMAMTMLLRRLKIEHATVHGFRSTFRDWAGDKTTFPREVAEAALAHEVGNAVERAYRRADALEKRRGLMESWAEYCC